MIKKGIILMVFILSVLMISTATAATMGETFGGVWDSILSIGSLEFILGGDADNKLFGFVRIAIGIIIFSILYMALSAANAGMGGNAIPKNIAITISIVMAIITSIFIPATVLATFASTYAVIFSFIIIGGPMIGIGWMVFGTPTPNRGAAVFKLFGILFLWWVISEISHWAGELAAAGGI